jgi:hypothetical protein
MTKIGYARVSTADQHPQLQLDALAAAGCLKIYTDHASGTKADRPHWNACLADLRSGDTLIMWRIDRLGRNLRDLIDIVRIRSRPDPGTHPGRPCRRPRPWATRRAQTQDDTGPNREGPADV